jgi:hypothetical protein
MSQALPRDRAGWVSNLPTFHGTEARVVCLSLGDFVKNPGPDQVRAWSHWIPELQREVGSLLNSYEPAREYTAILEYELPRDLRRPDVVVLEQGVVIVLELKGRPTATRAGIDQVVAYARDLRAYHIACHKRQVIPVLVMSGASHNPALVDDVWIVGPSGIHKLLLRLAEQFKAEPLPIEEFLREDAYEPLPSIVQAARRLFEHGELPFIKRARAHTDPALAAITTIAKEAAATRTRHLVVLTGVPGSGKTLVGLQLVHAHWLDELAVPRAGGKPSAPAAFLSGNGPLVTVLQDALKSDGSGGQTFVQAIKKYVAYYSNKRHRIPPEHLIVFDEAQRAHDAGRVAHVHKQANPTVSEPQHLLEFLHRVPEWCVLVALIGSGQSIHQGEEGGLPLWREAVETVGEGEWTVHAAETARDALLGAKFNTRWNPSLNLDVEIRHHLVPKVHQFVSALLDENDVGRARRLSEELYAGGFRFLVTDDLNMAKDYLRDRYDEAPLARYGLVASSKDKILQGYGVDNTFQTTKRLRVGPWFNTDPQDPKSCCQLAEVGTEFAVQGLELDMALLAWGSDLLRLNQEWSILGGRGTRGTVHDPHAMRRNVYRVLLTRGRDGTVIFVPRRPEFEETRKHLGNAGLVSLS